MGFMYAHTLLLKEHRSGRIQLNRQRSINIGNAKIMIPTVERIISIALFKKALYIRTTSIYHTKKRLPPGNIHFPFHRCALCHFIEKCLHIGYFIVRYSF